MGKFVVAGLVLLINLTSLLPSLACSTCPKPPSPPKPKPSKCPIDMLKLDTCIDLLEGLVHVGIGTNTKDKCYPMLEGLVDLDAALCLWTTIKAKLLNITLLLPIALELLVDCGKHPPSDYQCPA